MQQSGSKHASVNVQLDIAAEARAGDDEGACQIVIFAFLLPCPPPAMKVGVKVGGREQDQMADGKQGGQPRLVGFGNQDEGAGGSQGGVSRGEADHGVRVDIPAVGRDNLDSSIVESFAQAVEGQFGRGPDCDLVDMLFLKEQKECQTSDDGIFVQLPCSAQLLPG